MRTTMVGELQRLYLSAQEKAQAGFTGGVRLERRERQLNARPLARDGDTAI